MCLNCRAFITTDDRVCPYCDMKLGQRADDVRSPGQILGGLIPQARFTTVIILLINFGLFAIDYFVPSAGVTNAGASMPAVLMRGQWYRLITRSEERRV